jgi:peptidoglycan/xylan/chitin deacetylase (PgdA/CDA1 family)
VFAVRRHPTAPRIGIKVDVDTFQGTREGVPRLLDILGRHRVRASFYLSLGPDRSGMAIFRLFRPGFLAKQLRNKAPGTYGWRTMLYGTLLPAPIIGQGIDAITRRMMDEGHEAGLHAWDHVAWHDGLWRMDEAKVRAEIDRGLSAFSRLFGRPPQGFAAPAWRYRLEAAMAFQNAGLTYSAATRGGWPYFPIFGGRTVTLLELPTTLPTADEVLGSGGITPDNIDRFFLDLMTGPAAPQGLQVLTIHAETEGGPLAPAFDRLLAELVRREAVFVRLVDAAREFLVQPSAIPRSEVVRKSLPGRPGDVSHQADGPRP